MKYKVGDKVRIKSKEWYDANKDDEGTVDTPMGFLKCMSEFCGKEAVVTQEHGSCYDLDIDDGDSLWDDDMIECLVSDTPEKSIISTDLIKDIAEVVKSHNLGVCVSEKDGKLIIEPLEEKEEEDLPIETPCMCSDEEDGRWVLGYYASKGRVFEYSMESDRTEDDIPYNYIIPFDKFDPNDIEESLKYNIVKQ